MAGSGYEIEIFDADTMTELAHCSSGTTCVGVDDVTADRDFIAYVAAPSSSAPPPDIQAQAVPADTFVDLSNIPVTGSEIATWLPTGDDADTVVPRPSGDVYRDALFPYVLQAFNIVHGYALSLGTEVAGPAYPGNTIRASLGAFTVCSPTTPGVQGVPGAGPNGGYGFPDLTATDPALNQQLWEMKYDSAAGHVKGAQQILRYVTKSQESGRFTSVVAGAPFDVEQTGSLSICPGLLPDGWGPIQVHVYSSASALSAGTAVPGLEVYKVSFNDIYALAAGLAAAAGFTRNAIANGALREVRIGAEVQVLLNNVIVFDYKHIPGVPVFVVA